MQGCESLTLACAGSLNITLGDDCTAEIELSTVLLSPVLDENRFRVEFFEGTTGLGATLDESHVGREITYRVFDDCFGEQTNCWGVINLENKIVPSRTSSFREIICGQGRPSLLTIPELMDQRDTVV